MCSRPVKPAAPKTERPALLEKHGPPGGLFGIDQEVVTLRGLYGNSGYQIVSSATDAGLESKLTG
jgi:hypothetical protein